MKVEIWSDVMCPFCYIGKRKFENALNRLAGKEKVEIEWKSFELNPGMRTQPGKSVHQYLAEIKGWTPAYAKKMNDHVTGIAADVGLTYHLDKAIIANSFDAHRLSHLAKKYGLQDKIEEALFAAYFTEVKNTADHKVLLDLAVKAGLDESEVKQMLEGDDYHEEVQADEAEAHRLGIHSVPYFVFNRRYAVSGAQAPEIFTQALNTSYREWEKERANISLLADDAASCGVDGIC